MENKEKSFLGLGRDWKWSILKGGNKTGWEVGWVLNARDREIPKISWKKFGAQKARPGMQTSIFFPIFVLLLFLLPFVMETYVKKMILTSKQHSKIPFAGLNTQQWFALSLPGGKTSM